MTLVDTSAWVEWLVGSTTGGRLVQHLPKQSNWLVPTMVQFELAKWLVREVGEERADQVIAFTQVCRVVPLDTEIALAAAEVSRAHKLAMADAIIFATAQKEGAQLLTCDKHFSGLSAVLLIEKT
jgi:predicted nucleic acid-binding protein